MGKKEVFFLSIGIFVHSFAFSQLSGKNRVTISKWMLEESVPKAIEVAVNGNIGHYPNWDGLSSIINDLNISVQDKLRSTQPYKVIPYQNVLKTNFIVRDTNFTRIENSGNRLVLGITLQECSELERDWFFDFYSSVYPGSQENISIQEVIKNTEERSRYIERDSKIKRIGNDKKIIEYLDYPSKESYKIVTNIVSGPKYKNEAEYQAANTNNPKNPREPLENNNIVSNDTKSSTFNPVNGNTDAINKSNSGKSGTSTLSDDPSVAINQLIKLKSVINSSKKMTPTQKQEALVKLNDAIKQYRDLIELDKLGKKWNEFLNFNDGQKENGKITNSRLLEYLNEVDRKLLLRILNREIDLDPQSKHGSSCGTIITNCRQCGDRISVTSRYRSIGYIIRDLNDLPVFYILNESEVKELKSYFQKIRSGNNYICDAYNDEKFCSKQHKFLFQQR